VDVGPALEAHQEAAELVQPGEAALDRPALATQPRAVGGAPAGDQGADATPAQLAPVGVVVVAAVGHERRGPAPRPADPARERRHGIHERDQLGDVVAVAAGQADGEREARGVGEEVVL
jgi:hypothetical protein